MHATKPVYTTVTNGTGDLRAAARHARIVKKIARAANGRTARMWEAEERGCTPDYCHVCRRATDHYGEHSEAQLLAYYDRIMALRA